MRLAASALLVAVLGAACTSPSSAVAPATTATAAAATTTTPAPAPPCPGLGPPLDAVVRRLRAPDGTCLPAGVASTYRCSPTAPVPVAVVDGRRFLGGGHATDLATAPVGTRTVGTAEDGITLAVDPADGTAVYVSGATGVQRWPAVPAHPDATGRLTEGNARPAVFVVGDSVILGAEAQLRAAFGPWWFTLDAAVSRFTRDGIEVLRRRRGEVADIVVVALGYNDGMDVERFRATAGALLDELAGVPLVVWVNLRATQPYYTADNAVLLELAAARPNVVVADWSLASGAMPAEHFAADGLHLGAVSAQAMADLVAGTVLGWHRRHPEQGDQSCRPAFDAAVGAGS